MKFTGWGHTHSLIHTDMFLTPLDRAWQQGGAMRSFSLIVWMMTHRQASASRSDCG